MRQNLDRLDGLIAVLQELRDEMGNCEVGIEDADTGCSMRISGVKRDSDDNSRLLIDPAGYSRGGCFSRT